MIKETVRELKVFYSYAREDEELRQRLQTHLGVLKYQHLITDWHDREIRAGEEWAKQIQVQLETADIILLLISPDFLNSPYINSIEMKKALERHNAREAWVIPIILVPVYWKDTPFSKLLVLPKDGKPVASWDNRDAAFADITEGISKVVKEFPPRTKEQWCNIASSYYHAGADFYKQALYACEEAIRLDDKYARAYNRKGDILYRQGPRKNAAEKALKLYEKAIEENPKYPAPHAGRGKVLYDSGKYKEALAAYERAIEIDPTYTEAIRGRDKVLQTLGRQTPKPAK